MGNDREPVPGCLSSPLLPQEATVPGEIWALVPLVWWDMSLLIDAQWFFIPCLDKCLASGWKPAGVGPTRINWNCWPAQGCTAINIQMQHLFPIAHIPKSPLIVKHEASLCSKINPAKRCVSNPQRQQGLSVWDMPIFLRKKVDNPGALQLSRKGVSLVRKRSIRLIKQIPKRRMAGEDGWREHMNIHLALKK